jgi:cytochrome c
VVRAARFLLPALLFLALPAGTAQGALVGHGGPVKAIAVSGDGTRALTAGFDYSVILWDLAQQKPLTRLLGHDAGVNAVAFLADGRRGVSASDDGTLILWDLEEGSPAARWRGHRGKVAALAVSRDGKTVASGGWDHEVRLWDAATGASRVLAGHAANVNSVAFSRDGVLLASADYDGRILLWRVANGSLVATLPGNGFSINALAFAPNGRLLSASSDKTVRVWDAGQRREIFRYGGREHPVLALALASDDRDGMLVASATSEGTVDLWRLADGALRRSLYAARGPIWALAFSRDARVLLSSGSDGIVRLWDVGDGHELSGAVPPVSPPVEAEDRGARLFRKCRMCHSLTENEENKAGPTLHHLFGRRAGAVAGYPYSPALSASGLVWSEQMVDRLFAEGPEVVAPGSKMPLQKMPSAQDRADLIDYLKRATGP